MFVSVGWIERSRVLPEKRLVWKRRSMPLCSCLVVSVLVGGWLLWKDGAYLAS